MVASWTNVFFEWPWLASAVWIVLHSLDYYLTLYACRLYKTGGQRFWDFDGSFEMNPAYQADVERMSVFPRRFALSLFLPAIALYVVTALAEARLHWLLAFVIGAIIFTRASVIGSHMSNIWLFRRACRPDAPFYGHIKYERRVLISISVLRLAEAAAILGVATCLAPNPWTFGGAVGLALAAVLLRRRALRALRKTAAPEEKARPQA